MDVSWRTISGFGRRKAAASTSALSAAAAAVAAAIAKDVEKDELAGVGLSFYAQVYVLQVAIAHAL